MQRFLGHLAKVYKSPSFLRKHSEASPYIFEFSQGRCYPTNISIYFQDRLRLKDSIYVDRIVGNEIVIASTQQSKPISIIRTVTRLINTLPCHLDENENALALYQQLGNFHKFFNRCS